MPWLSEDDYKLIRNHLIHSEDREAGEILIRLIEHTESNRKVNESEKSTENLTNNEKVNWFENGLFLFLTTGFLAILMLIIGIEVEAIFPAEKITFFLDEHGRNCIKINNPYPSNSGIEKVGVRINDPDLDNITKESSETYCGEGRDLIDELPLSRYELIFEDIDKNK